jgi:hypothetical protein
MGVGCIIGVISIGATSDRIFKYLSKKHGAEKPESRLPIMAFSSLFTPMGLFLCGGLQKFVRISWFRLLGHCLWRLG